MGLDDTCLYSSTQELEVEKPEIQGHLHSAGSKSYINSCFKNTRWGTRNDLCISAILYDSSILRTLSPFIKIIVSPIRAYIPTPYLVKVVFKPGMVAHTYNVSIQ